MSDFDIARENMIHNQLMANNVVEENILEAFRFVPKEIFNKFTNSIIYESSDFIIVNKWTGIFTQGGSKTGISIDDIIKNIEDEEVIENTRNRVSELCASFPLYQEHVIDEVSQL